MVAKYQYVSIIDLIIINLIDLIIILSNIIKSMKLNRLYYY